MMEILFRGKLINGQWVFWNVFGFIVCDDGKSFDHVTYSGVTRCYVNDLFALITTKTVGQYTGFTDMNGVKIFVGDITEIEYGGWKVRREIVFSQGAFQYLNSGGLSPMPMRYIIKDFNTFYGVVIGNIHDNPEVTE